MKLTKIFDSDYSQYFNKSAQYIPLLLLLNVLCVPLSKLLIILRLKPSTITSISNVLSLLAVLSLLYVQNPLIFPIFWVLGLFFDISDGMVARKTKQTSASGSFYDHMSDQVKFILLFIACGMKYSDPAIWILSYISSTFFLFATILNKERAYRNLRFSVFSNLEEKREEIDKTDTQKLQHSLTIFERITLKKVIRGVRNSIFLMQGNCLLFLIPLSFSRDLAAYSMIFFILITAYNIHARIGANRKVNSMLTAEKISWK